MSKEKDLNEQDKDRTIGNNDYPSEMEQFLDPLLFKCQSVQPSENFTLIQNVNSNKKSKNHKSDEQETEKVEKKKKKKLKKKK